MPEPGSPRRSHTTRAALLWLAGILCVSPAMAHKLKVFASAVGNRIEGSAYFVGGSPAAGATILVQDSAGSLLAHLSPAKDGTFSYQALAPIAHVLVARSDDGHEASWRIGADELAPAFAPTGAPGQETAPPPQPADPSEPTVVQPSVPAHCTDAGANLDPRMTAAIEQAVARQVRPLREQLNAAQDEIRLHDILGGIGYILGLTGIALWLRSRRPERRP